MDTGDIRKEFDDHAPLSRNALAADPFTQFQRWLETALHSDFSEPTAFVLATVDSAGQCSQRTVLLKFFDENGFVFYTNYQSRKAEDIAGNARVSMLFPWLALQRQVKIEGVAEKVSREQSLKYFLSRPRGSQLGAWTSPQSRVVESREYLMMQWQKMRERFRQGEVPLPDFWGGYRIVPEKLEFWQGQPSRLHDRFLYSREDGGWSLERLAP